MRVIVSGGRAFTDKARVYAALDAIHAETPITTIVHGACGATEKDPDPPYGGADGYADDWAVERGVPVEPFFANWKRFKFGAGPERNRRMTGAGADLAVVFPGGKGTANLVKEARSARIKVVEG
jgi:hypothetical protein